MEVMIDTILGKAREKDEGGGGGGVTPQDVEEAINTHNTDADAHEGNLLPSAESEGLFPIRKDGSWVAQLYGGETNEEVDPADSILAMPEKVYIVPVESDTDMYVNVLPNVDISYNFEVVAVIGNTGYSFTLDGNTLAVYWPDNNVPPRFSASNPQPLMNQPNTIYVVRCRWDVQAGAILANLAYTVGA